MDTWIWVVVAVIAIPLAWWCIKSATAFVVPVSTSGRAYLRQALARRGIDPRTIPDACINDFVEFAQKANFLSRPSGARFRADVVRSLDNIADIFILWRTRPDDSLFTNRYGTNSYREIFERYGIK